MFKTHGNAYSAGMTDLICHHPEHGFRFIDVKNPIRYEFTPAQIRLWPVFEANEWGVYIITAATEEEYKRLFRPPNFRDYWKDRYNRYNQTPQEIIKENYPEIT